MEDFLVFFGGIIVTAAMISLLDRLMTGRTRQEQARARQRGKQQQEYQQQQERSKTARVQELTQQGDRRAIELLLDLLSSENSNTLRHVAVEAVAERVQSGEEKAFWTLLHLLQGRDSETAVLAIKKLGQIRDTRAVEPLLKEMLTHDPTSRLYTQTAEALAHLIRPGDEAVVRFLWGSGAQHPDAQSPDQVIRLSLAEVVAWGRFGDARAVLSLVMYARLTSGAEAEVSFEDGHPAFIGACEAAVKALEQILERDAVHASEKALRCVLQLENLENQPFPYSEHDRYQEIRESINCGRMHQLARQELQRRGLEP